MMAAHSSHPASRRLILLPLILICLSAFAAQATVPLPDDEGHPPPPELRSPASPPGDRLFSEYLGPFNYLREFDQIVGFLDVWQLDDPDSPDHGGMIEAESGDLGDVIQTDNTLEAIWCWSRYREFSGRTTYDDNIAKAWIYCVNYPAWLEEGAIADNYYRAHNCAWGLEAVTRYKAATGDDSFDWYAEECAQYIVTYPLILAGSPWYVALDAFCKGWCAGNLYRYGQEIGNPAYLAEAVIQGQDVLDWLNADPGNNQSWEYWAMSSGTAIWGVFNSVFKDDPLSGLNWLAINHDNMPLWTDWWNVPGYVWDNAWNVAYGNAHFAFYDLAGAAEYRDDGQFCTDHLLSYDTDDDGGITAESIDENTEDMSWVTCYLCKFGVDRLMGDPYDHDTGVLRFAGIDEGDTFQLGTPIPVRLLPTNYGLFDEMNVEVVLSGDAGEMTQFHDLPFAALDTLDFLPGWLPDEGGDVTLTARTNLPGDQDASNDEVSVSFHIHVPTAAPGAGPFARGATVTRNPFWRETGIRFALAATSEVRLEIFDVRGRRIATVAHRPFAAGEHTLVWDGSIRGGSSAPAGLYLYRFSAGGESQGGKLLKLR